MKKHVCIICGYVYDDALPFENLPHDYVCPICGVGKDKFDLLSHDHKESFLRIDYGLYLITTKSENKDNGCIIDALMQISDNPPVVAFSLNKNNYTHELITKSKVFNISILTEDAPKELFQVFSTTSGKYTDKFSQFKSTKRSPNGIYYLTKYINTRLSGKIVEAIDCHTHTLFKAEIEESEIINNNKTLNYSTYRKNNSYKQMFCFQCQQTAKGTGCTMVGVCGKKADTANSQDELTAEMINLATTLQKNNIFEEKYIDLIVDGLFTTITNVNFDTKRINSLIEKIKTEKLNLNGVDVIQSFEVFEDAPDILSLRSTLLFGLRGMAAYAHHARVLGKRREDVDKWFIKGLASLGEKNSIDHFLSLLMEFGNVNLNCMALLEEANTNAYGNPTPVNVSLTIEKGPFIVVTGHDLYDLKMLLEQSEGKGVNIYTHGEVLPAFGYPELRKYKHLKGNFGTAWQNQQQEFDNIPGPILYTTNCLMPPKSSYSDRIYTTSVVYYPELKYIEESENGLKDFTEIIEHAIKLKGYSEDKVLTGINGGKTVTTGFGKQTILDNAGVIIDAVKKGDIKHFFLVGGCDGAKPGRSYYTDFVKKTPNDTIILTLACGKFRFNDLDLGSIGPFPRILDLGQCNDAYGAIQVAIALANAFECGVNDLPLTLVLSWYEQKAVCILLTLLSLGIKNIYIGPSIPAFFSENVLNLIIEKFNLKPISTPEKDLEEILNKKI